MAALLAARDLVPGMRLVLHPCKGRDAKKQEAFSQVFTVSSLEWDTREDPPCLKVVLTSVPSRLPVHRFLLNSEEADIMYNRPARPGWEKENREKLPPEVVGYRFVEAPVIPEKEPANKPAIIQFIHSVFGLCRQPVA